MENYTDKYEKLSNITTGVMFALGCFEDDTIPQVVITDVEIGDFLKGENLIDIGHELSSEDGTTHYRQYFTNNKIVDHVFENNHLKTRVLLQTEFNSSLELLENVQEKIKQAIELQKQIENE
ncbi:hypothetical protein HB816_08620 [Listeria booriae]|uniref:hypothetical protein n=1 Tax=Listeria booriae TaxID=1552123 RepID=UPI0016294568|nr:hypothetical protein [Listeria booriae]MBC1230505.1 hypothetical protein [Listeria booriae]